MEKNNVKNADLSNEITNRLVFLADEFKIFEKSEIETFVNEIKSDTEIEFIKSKINDSILGIKKKTLSNQEKSRYKVSVYVSDSVFADMVVADPTDNKEFLQWMLTVFRNMIKDDSISNDKARQFVEEDLKLANKYLELFNKNKRKKKFKDLCNGSYGIPKTDPTNINQYTSLSQLFNAVDPFIEREPSTLERAMIRFKDSGQAKIPFRDRKWTVYIPLTTEANCVMHNFANWCTASPGNTMFNSYTNNNKTPNGEKSNIYVIVNNDLFEGKTDECYQIHFESRQIKGRQNSSNVNIYEPVLSTSDGISEYFKEELTRLVMMSKDRTKNTYIDYLVSFGFTEALFNLLDEKQPVIKFEGGKGSTNFQIPKLPDITRFKHIDELMLLEVSLVTIHPSIGSLINLELLSLPDNKIKELPREIGNLKNLEFINLKGNPITVIPDEIKYLDKSNGGSLYRISINESDCSKENYLKLKKLLPTTIISGE